MLYEGRKHLDLSSLKEALKQRHPRITLFRLTDAPPATSEPCIDLSLLLNRPAIPRQLLALTKAQVQVLTSKCRADRELCQIAWAHDIAVVMVSNPRYDESWLDSVDHCLIYDRIEANRLHIFCITPQQITPLSSRHASDTRYLVKVIENDIVGERRLDKGRRRYAQFGLKLFLNSPLATLARHNYRCIETIEVLRDAVVLATARHGLQSERLVIAGMGLFMHSVGNYSGSTTTPNAYTLTHDRDTELQFIMSTLLQFRGKLVNIGDVLNAA